MTKINGINLNVQSQIAKVKKEETAKKEVIKEATPELNRKSADEVLNFMAGSSADLSTSGEKKTSSTKTIQVSKYVTSEQAKRIAGFVQEFSGAVETGLKEFEKELGSLPQYQSMSDAAKLDVAVESFVRTNMPDAIEA